METRIELCDGKYTICLTDHGTIADFLRYGEPWPAADCLAHSGLVLAMTHEIMSLRGQVEPHE